jgi:hypothetical protein
MSATQTFVVDLERLQMHGADAHLVILLMRATDDIAVANWGLRHFSREDPKGLRRHVQLGARRYFVRLQCGHLFEGLKLIEQLRRSPKLMSIVSRCDQSAQDAFARLGDYVRGGVRRPEFEQKIGLIRHKAAFHYDAKLVAAALTSRAHRKGLSLSTITRGTDMELWRSGLSDDIEDTIVCRLLWRIPLDADLQAEANKILDFGSAICRDFLDFSAELAFRFLGESAVV